MKKRIALFLIAVAACCVISISFAEEGQKSGEILDSISSFFSNTWNDASGWVEGAWTDTTKWVDVVWKDATVWIKSSWGDASKWIEQAWNDSSTWVSDIWGDASNWAADTVSAWWTSTFNIVTQDSKDAWAWIKDRADRLKAYGVELFESVKDAVSSADEHAEEKLEKVFFSMLEKLSINETDANKVWETICSYAEQKNISTIATIKLSIPYLLQLCVDSAEQSNVNIPAVAVAQYLTGIIEKLGINDNDAAYELVIQLNDALSDI